MTTKVSTPRPIQITPGVQPVGDWTAAATPHYVFSKAIRFVDGIPEKIGGWIAQLFDYGATVSGTIRSVYTEIINGKYYVLLGSNEKLYSLIGSRLTNITPLQTSSIAISASLSTQYGTLANNPFASTNGSPVLTVSDSEADRFEAGDIVYFSGATGFAGILAGAINGDHIVRSIGVNSYTINVGVNANASTSGGGASVVRSSGLINISDAAHGQVDGDRIKIEDAADTGGILSAEINAEHIIRNVDTNDFDIMTIGESTSSVTAGGGASTIYYQEIPDGLVNETITQGYGAGFYGAGLYGTALLSNASRSFPRIWFMDRYANTLIMTPGNQTGLYQWFGTTETAPELILNAPTAINYAFVSNGIIVTFGAGGVENNITACDQNNITVWTSSATNQVFIDDIEGVGRLTSHCPAQDLNLIFTENETYTFRYIGLPFVWEVIPLDETVGIIAPMARVSVKGMAFWMSQENFYMYRGGKPEIIKSNTQDECTALRYVFDDLNWGQKSKIFGWYNPKYNEVWFHYPSANSNEPDRVIRVSIQDFVWTIDEMPRTAAEYPSVKTQNPYLANVSSLYKHELGRNDNDSPLDFSLVSPKMYNGKNTVNLTGIIPDSNQVGDIDFTANGYLYPQSVEIAATKSITVSPTTEYIQMPGTARYWQYTWEGDVLDQSWEMGQWFDDVQQGAGF
jgi:hypothetical protein